MILGRLKDEFKVHLLCERVRGFCVRNVGFSVAVARRRLLAAAAGQAQEKLVVTTRGRGTRVRHPWYIGREVVRWVLSIYGVDHFMRISRELMPILSLRL